MYYVVSQYTMTLTYVCALVSFRISLRADGMPPLRTKYCTPEINTSEIIVDSSGIVQWMFGGIFQRNFTFQLYFPTACHLSSGFSLELSHGFSMACSNGSSFLWFLVCNRLPWSMEVWKAPIASKCNQGSGGTERATSVNIPLLRLQSSEGEFAMSREIKPVRRSCYRHGCFMFTEVARLGLLVAYSVVVVHHILAYNGMITWYSMIESHLA